MFTILALALANPVATPAPAFQRGCPEEASAYHYRTRNKGWRGVFRYAEERIWVENTDQRAGGKRDWEQVDANRPCVIRLEDGDAVIEIDTRTGSIWYTDPNYRGYPRLTNLYVVTRVE
ncbi:MAG: hypothetical protein V4808_08825 [Pseudomonadota bacterium]